MSLRLAAMSRRSMRLASETSSTAVSRGTLPISRKYMRTGSLLGDLHREVELGGSLVVAIARLGGSGRGIALDDLDAQVGQGEEQLVELLDGELDVAQRGRDVGAAEVALLVALFDEPTDLVAVQQRQVGGGDVVFGGGFGHWSSPALRRELGPRGWPVRLRRTRTPVRTGPAGTRSVPSGGLLMRRAVSKRPTNNSKGATVDCSWPVVPSDEAAVVHLTVKPPWRRP